MQSRRRSLLHYLSPSVDLCQHFMIVRGPLQYGFGALPCLLARARPDGRFELISRAWDALGYSDEDLAGRGICELMELEPRQARAAMRALLSEASTVDFGLRGKDGRETRYHWTSQFDDFNSSMMIIGDELPVAPSMGTLFHPSRHSASMGAHP